MTLNQKLQFQSFDPGENADEETFSEAEIEAARQDGFAAGREAALAEHLQSAEHRLTELLQQVTQRTAALGDAADDAVTDLTGEVLDIAMLAVRKVLPATAAANGLSEIEGLVRSCLSDLRAEPRVAVRLHVEALQSLQPRLEDLAASTGFDGKLVLLADDDLAPTDCTVLWADGGATRRVDDITTAVDAAIERFRAQDGAAPTTGVAQGDTAAASPPEPAEVHAEPAEPPAVSPEILPPDAAPDQPDAASPDAGPSEPQPPESAQPESQQTDPVSATELPSEPS